MQSISVPAAGHTFLDPTATGFTTQCPVGSAVTVPVFSGNRRCRLDPAGSADFSDTLITQAVKLFHIVLGLDGIMMMVIAGCQPVMRDGQRQGHGDAKPVEHN